jgi:ABC-2 type transport system permease protein
MGEMQALYALWKREVKVFQREKSRVISAMASPILWILLVGTGFGATTEFTDPRYAQFSYQEFMYPGVIAMTVLFGTVFFGMYIVWDRKMDVLKEVLVAPVSRTTIFFGKVLGGSTESFLQGILLLVIGMIFFGVSLAGALMAIPFVLLLAIGFVSVGLFIGSFFDSFEGFQVVVSFLIFPLFFLSGALYPLDGLPGWLTVLTRLNPATYAVDGLRGALLGVHAFHYLVDVGVLVAFGAVFIGLGTWSFRRMT